MQAKHSKYCIFVKIYSLAELCREDDTPVTRQITFRFFRLTERRVQGPYRPGGCQYDHCRGISRVTPHMLFHHFCKLAFLPKILNIYKGKPYTNGADPERKIDLRDCMKKV